MPFLRLLKLAWRQSQSPLTTRCLCLVSQKYSEPHRTPWSRPVNVKSVKPDRWSNIFVEQLPEASFHWCWHWWLRNIVFEIPQFSLPPEHTIESLVLISHLAPTWYWLTRVSPPKPNSFARALSLFLSASERGTSLGSFSGASKSSWGLVGPAGLPGR